MKQQNNSRGNRGQSKNCEGKRGKLQINHL